jgi:hypothetical protein
VAEQLELAIRRVREAMDRVAAAWEAEQPDAPARPERPSPPAWRPDPTQAPVITRRRAEVTRLRAASLCATGRRVLEQAKLVHQTAQELHASLRRLPAGPRAVVSRPPAGRADA